MKGTFAMLKQVKINSYLNPDHHQNLINCLFSEGVPVRISRRFISTSNLTDRQINQHILFDRRN